MMKKTAVLFLMIGLLTACKKDSEDSNSNDATRIIIEVLDEQNNDLPVVGINVYAISDAIMSVNDSTAHLYADKVIQTDEEGKATFLMDEINGVFDGSSNVIYHFLVRYTKNGSNNKVSSGFNFSKSDQIEKTIKLF